MLRPFRQAAGPAVRALARRPGFSATCIATLAVGMGASTAIFSVLDAVLLRDLPWKHADRTVVVARQLPSGVRDPDFTERELRAFAAAENVEEVGGFVYGGANVVLEGRAYGLWITHVTEHLFATLGAEAALGRLFRPEEFVEGASRVVVLSDVWWRQQFGGDPAVVGRTLVLDGIPRLIVGVAAPDFRMPTDYRWEGQTEIWAPLPLRPRPGPSASRYLWLVARLRAGASLEGAAAQLGTTLAALAATFPGEYEAKPSVAVHLTPVEHEVLGAVRPALLLLMGAVAFVLLIACTNVAQLLLARSEERQRDLALRSALGAGRGRLLREMFAEGLLLGLAAGAAGLLLARAALPAMLALAPANLPRLERVSIDGTAMGFAAAAALFTPLLFGFMPAWQASREAVADSLQPGGRTATTSSRGTRRALIAGEAALAAALLAASGLLIKSFARLSRVDPGFDVERVLTADLVLPEARYPDPAAVFGLFDAVRARVAEAPGVRSVALSTTVPYWNPAGRAAYHVEGRPDTETQPPVAAWQAASPGLLGTAGIALREGRDFTDRDREGAPAVALVNHTLARGVLAGRAIGARIRLSDASPRPWLEVVGVVEDVRDEAADRYPRGQVYVPFRQMPAATGRPARYMALVVRTDQPPGAVVPAVRGAVAMLDPELPLASVRGLDERLAQSTARYRFATVLLGLLAATALGLAAVGVFAVLLYTVGRRRREIAIRVAVGARAPQVLRSVMGEGLAAVAVGVAGGALLAMGLTRYLDSLLYEVSPTEPSAFAGAVLVLGAAALFAAWLPARRALAVDPARILRSE
jgi:putative ABC transport system permease protein